MDYALAIRRNRDQLRAIVLTLFALAGLRPHRSLPVGPDGRPLFTLPRSVITIIMLVLRPAESALRRLILIAAFELRLKAVGAFPFSLRGSAGRLAKNPQAGWGCLELAASGKEPHPASRCAPVHPPARGRKKCAPSNSSTR